MVLKEGEGILSLHTANHKTKGFALMEKKFVSSISLKLDTAPKTRFTLLKHINKLIHK